jgi:hypothetical protein
LNLADPGEKLAAMVMTKTQLYPVVKLSLEQPGALCCLHTACEHAEHFPLLKTFSIDCPFEGINFYTFLTWAHFKELLP